MKNKNIYIEEEVDLKMKINKLKRARKKKKCAFLFISKQNIIFLIVIIIFISIYNIYKIFKRRKLSDNDVKKTEIIINNGETTKDHKKEEYVLRERNYLDKCFQGILINNQNNIKLSNEPKITVIIPVYNNENKIKSVIRSAQNQNLEDIEIILVNDFSTDNTLKIIEEMKTEDPRIKIINNDKNKGISYSRSIAVLEAKGKYITNLDQDDFFLDKDVFEKVYKEAENGTYDIVSFMNIDISSYHAKINEIYYGKFTNHLNDLIVRQPELAYFSFFKDGHIYFNDIQISGKLFRTQVYKNAINLLGEQRYSTFNIINEDPIVYFAICNAAQSYKYFRKYGLLHLINNPITSSTKVSSENHIEMILFFIDVLFDLSINENKKYAAIGVIDLYNSIIYLGPKNKSYLENILKKIKECQFIDKKYKEEIKNKYIGFKF